MAKNSLMFSLSQCNNYKSRPLVKSAYQKNIFLISQPKHYVVGTQRDSSFESPKHMLKLMGKEIFTILRSKTLLILTCE